MRSENISHHRGQIFDTGQKRFVHRRISPESIRPRHGSWAGNHIARHQLTPFKIGRLTLLTMMIPESPPRP